MNNNYAGNISDNKDNQLVYHIKTNLKGIFNITNKHILYTETLPTPEELNKLNDPHYTIIYIKTPELAIIRHLKTRFESTPTKTLWSLAYNSPASVHFRYHDFNINYPASISNIQKQLSTHNTPVKLTDLTINYTLTITPCASGTETHIPDLNYQIYCETLRPYLKALRLDAQTQQQLLINKPKQLHPEILRYIYIWAPAYDIDLPPEPTDSLYNFLPLAQYNRDIMTIYNQLKTYEQYDLPINDNYTLCNRCNHPFHINLDFCPYCDESIDDELYLHLD